MPNPQKPPRMEKIGNVYYILWRGDGKPQRKSLRTEDLRTAENRFAGWLQKFKADEIIDTDPYVGDCLDIWFKQWIEGRMLSEIRYPAVINNLKAYLGNKRVSEVTRTHSLEYATMRRTGQIGWRGKKGAEATIRHELNKLRACFNFMASKVEPKERRISREIIPYVELPKPAPPRNRVLTTEELDKLRNFCESRTFVNHAPYRPPSDRIHRDARFIMLAMETAQRKTAILELKWDQIDLEKKRIQFNPYGRLQTSKRRPAIPISSRLITFLHKIYEEKINDYVLDSPTDIHWNISKIAHTLDIPGLSAHVFRHTWATRAVENGADLLKVASFLGDTIDTVRENYMHLSPDYLSDVVD